MRPPRGRSLLNQSPPLATTKGSSGSWLAKGLSRRAAVHGGGISMSRHESNITERVPDHRSSTSAPKWEPPPIPDFVFSPKKVERRSVSVGHQHPLRKALVAQPAAAILIEAPQGEAADAPELQAVRNIWMRTQPVGADVPPTTGAQTVAATEDAAPRRTGSSSAVRRLAMMQVVVLMVLFAAAPAVMLLTGRPAALAFAIHGIGATAVLVLATMAMHQAYPLLRGGVRTWPAFKRSLGRLAPSAGAQGLSGLWLLFYYHAEAGPAHSLIETAPLVDQLVMNMKIFAGLASLACFVVAWWSARSVTGERGDTATRAPIFALAAGWMLIVVAFALGVGTAWIASP